MGRTVPSKLRLRVGDVVMVRSGSHKGKTGKILSVLPAQNKVVVEGIQVVKRHVKPNRMNPKGAIVEKTVPVWASKVGVVHPTDSKKASRIKLTVAKDGTKKRVYQATGKEIA